MLSLQPSADRHLKFQRSHEAETVRGTSNFDPWRAFAMRASGNTCGTVSSLGEKTLDTREGDARKQAKLYTLTYSERWPSWLQLVCVGSGRAGGNSLRVCGLGLGGCSPHSAYSPEPSVLTKLAGACEVSCGCTTQPLCSSDNRLQRLQSARGGLTAAVSRCFVAL